MRQRMVSVVLLGAMTFIMAGGVGLSANAGSAVVANWRVYKDAAGSKVDSIIYVSNVTSHDVQATLRVYNWDGSGIGSISGLSIATNGFASCNGTNNSCTLAAGTTAYFKLTNNGANVQLFGHGVIEWSNTGTDNDSVALVSDGYIEYAVIGESVHRRTMTITRQQPF